MVNFAFPISYNFETDSDWTSFIQLKAVFLRIMEDERRILVQKKSLHMNACKTNGLEYMYLFL